MVINASFSSVLPPGGEIFCTMTFFSEGCRELRINKKNYVSISHTARAACFQSSSGVEKDPSGRYRVKTAKTRQVNLPELAGKGHVIRTETSVYTEIMHTLLKYTYMTMLFALVTVLGSPE